MILKSPHFRVADVRGSPWREKPWLRNSYKSLVMFAFSARPGIFESPRNPDFPKFKDFPRFCISSCCSEIGRFLLVVGDKVVTNKILTRLHGRMDPGGYRRWTIQDTSCQNQSFWIFASNAQPIFTKTEMALLSRMDRGEFRSGKKLTGCVGWIEVCGSPL